MEETYAEAQPTPNVRTAFAMVREVEVRLVDEAKGVDDRVICP